MHSDLTWHRLAFGMSDGELRFSLQAITNTTPTPDNLRSWGNFEIDSTCFLCGQTCTLRHVLNACKVSLLQGRYLRRQNLILGCLQKYLLDFWSSIKKVAPQPLLSSGSSWKERKQSIFLPLAKLRDPSRRAFFSDAGLTESFFLTQKPGWFSLRKLRPPHNNLFFFRKDCVPNPASVHISGESRLSSHFWWILSQFTCLVNLVSDHIFGESARRKIDLYTLLMN